MPITRQLLRRYLLGDRRTIAGTVYGTIVVLSVLAAGARTYEHHLWRLHEPTTLRWAFGVGILALAVQGIRYARLEQLGRLASVTTVSLNLALGLAIVAVEALVTH